MFSPELLRMESRKAAYQRELINPVTPVGVSELLYLPVLNAQNPSKEVLAFRAALKEDHRITLDYVAQDGLWLSGRFAQKAYPVLRVVDARNGQRGSFDGCYVGEVYPGAVHPLILIPREDARNCLNGQC
jgi:hypothetical protein